MKDSKTTVLICGLIACAATIIFYLLTFDNIFSVPMRWVSLLFLLIAECIGTGKSLCLNKSIFGIATTVSSILHLAAVLVLSIVFVNFLPLMLKTYLLINLLFLCALAAADIIVTHFGSHVAEVNKQMSANQSVMAACYQKAQALTIEYAQSSYIKELEAIADLIKYSDNSALSDNELSIMNKLDELGGLLGSGSDSADGKITEIKNLINLRSAKIAGTKRGSY